MRLGESIGMKSIVYSIIFVTVVLYYIYYILVDYMPMGEPQPDGVVGGGGGGGGGEKKEKRERERKRGKKKKKGEEEKKNK